MDGGQRHGAEDPFAEPNGPELNQAPWALVRESGRLDAESPVGGAAGRGAARGEVGIRTLLQTVEWSRRNSFPRPLPEPRVYSPRLRRDQVKAVYFFKRFEGRSMTKLVQEAVDYGGVEGLIERGRATFGDPGEEARRERRDG